MAIDYVHLPAVHTLHGARAALRSLFSPLPATVVDFGCGTGTWIKAALESGATDVLGIDGVKLDDSARQVPDHLILVRDLSQPIDLGRRFELALCLEVAEHLDERYAATLIASVCRHADTVLFSAACPNQDGMHHVNCQWPVYWQALFNANGFACDDACRWQLWDNTAVEPWYRQNVFMARRDPRAGSEPRIRSVVHPAQLDGFSGWFFRRHKHHIEHGQLPISWYPAAFLSALRAKLSRTRPFASGRVSANKSPSDTESL